MSPAKQKPQKDLLLLALFVVLGAAFGFVMGYYEPDIGGGQNATTRGWRTGVLVALCCVPAFIGKRTLFRLRPLYVHTLLASYVWAVFDGLGPAFIGSFTIDWQALVRAAIRGAVMGLAIGWCIERQQKSDGKDESLCDTAD